MDKIVFIPQPAANLLCAQVVTEMHSQVPLKEFSNVIVYADGLSSKINRNLEEIQMEANAVTFGLIPEHCTINAVVGIIKLGKLISSRPGKEYVYEVQKGAFFDNAMKMSKEIARNLTETDLFFTLPRYSMTGAHLSGDYGFLALYVNRKVFFSLKHEEVVTLEITTEIAKQLLNENGKLKKFDSIFLYHGNMMRCLEWNDKCFIETETDEEGNPVCYPSKNPPFDIPRKWLHIFCDYKH